MKLSFVIPAYNEEAYLPICLAAIAEQVGHDSEVEVIVVNNASTDRTKEVALAFPGVRVVDEQRKGITFARQAGLVLASGEIIAAIDADSILTPGWIKFVTKKFSTNKKLVAISGPFIYYDYSLIVNIFVRFYYYIAYLGYFLNRFIFRTGSLLQGGNMAIRRDALERVGGYDLSLNFYGEDADTARRLHALGQVLFTFRLPMYSSARRLSGEGIFTVAGRYTINYLWIMFFGRAKTHDYLDIRTPEGARVTFQTTLERFNAMLHATQLALVIILIAVSWYF